MKNLSLCLLAALLLVGCKKDEDSPQGGCNINLFTLQDDITLGMQLEAQIDTTPSYAILPEASYPQAYSYVRSLVDTILATGEVNYATEFGWKVYLLNDTTLNAFCAPGGYIYVYTGLIKFLDRGSDLAGVMGHEMAHADYRHTTCQMTQQYGLSFLTTLLLGTDPGLLAQLAVGLAQLSFSREDETEADLASVRYLCSTSFDAAGAATFFQKLIDLGATGGTPTFLSTHPNPDNRVQNIEAEKTRLGCTGSGPANDASAYAAMKATLP